MRVVIGVVALLLTTVVTAPSVARAQTPAPASGPLVLRLPATPRQAALGDAWVAGSDREVIFYNPAQLIGSRGGFDFSFARIGPDASSATVGSTFAAGKWSLALGWGAQILRFSTDVPNAYPLSPDLLLSRGSMSGISAQFAVGGAIIYRNFRIGGAAKYAFDDVPALGLIQTFAPVPPPFQSAFVVDVGVARSLWGGTFAGAIQNLGRAPANGSALVVPRQGLAGWSMSRGLGPLDMSAYAQVTIRDGWAGPGGGVEFGYGWIEGYNAIVRVGARRPDTDAGKPMSFGLGFTADRLTVEYGVQFFDGGRASHGVIVRWR